MRRCNAYLSYIIVITAILSLTFYFRQSIANGESNITQPSRFNYNSGMPDPNEILKSVNLVRKQHQLKDLIPNRNLEMVAVSRAKDMSKNNYYAHKNLRGLYFYDIFKLVNIKVGYACENLDLQASTKATVYVDDWYKSHDGHRECMLNDKINQVGYAVSRSETIETSDGLKQNFIVVAIQAEM